MLNSQKLAKTIVDRFINNKVDDAELQLGTMLENFRLSEINLYVTRNNMENLQNINEKQVLPKEEIPGIQRVKVWSRH